MICWTCGEWGKGSIKMNDSNDYHILGPYYGPRIVPDALHILALILRAINSDTGQKRKLGMKELKTCLRLTTRKQQIWLSNLDLPNFKAYVFPLFFSTHL